MNYILLVVLTILGWGSGAMLCKIGTNYISPIMLSVIMTAVYVLIVPIMFAFFKFDKTLNPIGLTFAILGAMAMGLGSITYFFALEKGEAGLTTAICGIYPSLTLILSAIFLGEGLTLKKVVGFLIVLFGSFILIKK